MRSCGCHTTLGAAAMLALRDPHECGRVITNSFRRRPSGILARWVIGTVLGALCVAYLIVVSPSYAQSEEVRKWTAGAHSVTGVLLSASDGVVTIRLDSGDEVEVSLVELSQTDREFVTAQTQTPGDGGPFRRKPSGTKPKPEDSTQASGQALREGRVQAVTVEGVGFNKKEAEEDAWRTAVRTVVGGYVDAETIVENDKLIRDTIITLSSAYVERAVTRRTRNEEGLIHVTVDAEVRLTKVLDTLRTHSVMVVDVADPLKSERSPKEATQQEQADAGKALIARAMRNYPENCVKVSFSGKPEITATQVKCRINVEPDMEAFSAMADQICEALLISDCKTGVLRNDSQYFGADDSGVPVTQDMFLFSNRGGLRRVVERLFPIQAQITDSQGGKSVDVHDMRSTMMNYEWGVGPLGDKRWGGGNEHPIPYYNTGKKRSLVLIPYRCTERLSRIMWRWFELPVDRHREFVRENNAHGIEMVLELLSAEGSTIADDLTPIKGLGWNSSPPHSSLREGLVVICPFVIGGDSLECFASSFSFERVITLEPSGVDPIKQVRLEVRPGASLKE